MLRSIVAVWCLAFALLVIAATAGCDLGGCANGDSCGGITPIVQDMARPPATCSQTCPPCAASETCFRPDAVAQLPPFCSRACTDDCDCAAGEKCASLFAAGLGPVCIAAGAPKTCATSTSGFSCDLQAASCRDASTAEVPFTDAADGVCGWELVHCANGCVAGACS